MSFTQLYRSKPQTVEGVHWTGDNRDEALSFGGPNRKVRVWSGSLQLKAGKDGCQGWVNVPVGHWLVNQPNDKSDIWPVEDTYFRAKYEDAEP